MSARCLEFLILTAARSGEVRGARWSEFDLAHKLWAIPASRMKAGREHRVPLSEPAMAVLREMAQFGSEGFVFPGLKAASGLSDVALAKAVDAGATVHGFRSTFRDWAAETTAYPRELAEAALAHALSDKVEAAYQRGDLLEKRRAMMTAWAAFCGQAMRPGEVVRLRTLAQGALTMPREPPELTLISIPQIERGRPLSQMQIGPGCLVFPSLRTRTRKSLPTSSGSRRRRRTPSRVSPRDGQPQRFGASPRSCAGSR